MGTLSRLAAALGDRLSRAIPEPSAEAEVTAAIAELKAHLAAATNELVAYKAHDKQATTEIERLTARAAELGSRAETAVRAGDDALARECLLEQQRTRATIASLEAERAQAAGHASKLLAARRELSARVTGLELKQRTLAMQVAAARQPGGGALAASGQAWDALERAEARIADAEATASLDAELGGHEADAKLAAGLAQARADVALAELKSRSPQAALPAPTGGEERKK